MVSRTLKKEGDIEGFGIVFLEANACGKPVIGGSDGGMGEAIEDGRTGLLVDPLNPQEIARAVIKLLSDKNYAQVLGENGRRRVIEEFNWGRAVNLFHQYMQVHNP
jgi:phosphatidylinositol alpha-1,6-mannosyltransferase